MKSNRFNRSGLLVVTLALFGIAAAHSTAPFYNKGRAAGPDTLQSETQMPAKTGRELYINACAACHGESGSGVAQSQLQLATPLPDFTDCDFAVREPNSDWIAVTHKGGPARAFSREMPAFGEALSDGEIQKIMDHIRALCTDKNWPRGELNLPRPLVTEKAYPEDEAVISTSIDMENEGQVSNELVYEHRIGARSQLELVVPFGFREFPEGRWNGGQLGDMAVGLKHALYHNLGSGTIFSVTGEVIFPTGDRGTGFGKGTTILEPFVSIGQLLPAGGFLHIQSGMEFPLIRDKAAEEAFLRGVLGTSLSQGRWGRTWSPMLELTGARELESGAQNQWDLIPQMQVTLNKRQNIMMNIGVRIPADDPRRDTRLMVYLLWDWFDGGLLDGW